MNLFVSRFIRFSSLLQKTVINSPHYSNKAPALHNCCNYPTPNIYYSYNPIFTRAMSATTATTTEKEFPPAKIQTIASEIASLLKERKETVCLAETAAGGITSASLLAQPGASKFYRGGLTLYTLESRIAFAGWTQENLTSYRGPTPDVVSGLARNVSSKLGATYTLCESGTAGPTGGNTPNRTPGYVALAIATDKGEVFTKELDTGLGTDREANMLAFAHEGLLFLKEVIKKGDGKL